MAHGSEHEDVSRLLDDAVFARAAADSIQALSAPSRLRILARLHAGPASVNELADAVGMESSAVSHQLRLLRAARLVRVRRAGRMAYYSLDDHHVIGLLHDTRKHVEEGAQS